MEDKELPHIRDAPLRIQRDYYRSERRRSLLAMSVIALVVGLIAFVIWRLV